MEPIVTLGAEILLTGLRLFNKERQLALSKEYRRLLTARDSARAAVYPDYTDKDVTETEKALKNFETAYAAEFSTVVDSILAGGVRA